MSKSGLIHSPIMSCSPSSSSASEDEDEGMDSYRKGGYHAVRIGDSFSGGRYIAQRKLGWGEFSIVWLAYDTRSSVSLFYSFKKFFLFWLKRNLLISTLSSFHFISFPWFCFTQILCEFIKIYAYLRSLVLLLFHD